MMEHDDMPIPGVIDGTSDHHHHHHHDPHSHHSQHTQHHPGHDHHQNGHPLDNGSVVQNTQQHGEFDDVDLHSHHHHDHQAPSLPPHMHHHHHHDDTGATSHEMSAPPEPPTEEDAHTHAHHAHTHGHHTPLTAPQELEPKAKRSHLWTLSGDKQWPKVVAGGIGGVPGRMVIDKIVAAYNDSKGRLHLVDNGMSNSRKAWRCCSVPRQRKHRTENACQYCHVARKLRVRDIEELRKGGKYNLAWDAELDPVVDLGDIWILSRPVEHTCMEKPARKQGRRHSAYTSKVVAATLLSSPQVTHAVKGNAEATHAFQQDLQHLGLDLEGQPLASAVSLTAACVARARKHVIRKYKDLHGEDDDGPLAKQQRTNKKIVVIAQSDSAFKELYNIVGENFPFGLEYKKISLPEPAGKIEDVARLYCLQACKEVKGPVLVEVQSLGMTALNHLPGVQATTFTNRIGLQGLVAMLDAFEDKCAYAEAAYGFCVRKGSGVHVFIGTQKGQIVQPRGDLSNDWDAIFQPDGEDMTYAEMGEGRKNLISHRALALAKFVKHIQENYSTIEDA
eukprot:m.23780 g.23780  ORF g.23780 m.23780 type:complete len:561 (+) comp7537_c0_seq2:190-1872(+)